jgi:hypothetical protein
MKQTAVEWLENQLKNSKYFYKLMEDINSRSTVAQSDIFKQAKEMENQQNLDMLIKFTDERTFLRKEVTKIWFEQFKKK